MAYGRSLLTQNSVFPTRVSSDGNPRYKSGGITIDWSTVAAAGSDVTLPDGSIIRSGQKYLAYGQVITKETVGTTQTFTSTGTGGTFTYTFIRPDNGQTVTTAAIAYNASAATVLAAIQAVDGPNQANSASGGVLATNPVVVTYGTTVALGTINNTLVTGGTVTVAQTTAGATGGWFGPYDPTASDGRQNLNRGDCFVLDETLIQYASGTAILSASNDQTGGAIDGGMIYIDRVIQSGTGSHSLAAGPTLAEFTAAFPAFGFTKD